MLRRTSKRVKEVVDKIHLLAVVRLNWMGFSHATRNCTRVQEIHFVMTQFTLMTVWFRISTLELSAKMLVGFPGVMCTVLAHLDLSCNSIHDAGTQKLAGILGQCRELVHLNLRACDICFTPSHTPFHTLCRHYGITTGVHVFFVEFLKKRVFFVEFLKKVFFLFFCEDFFS